MMPTKNDQNTSSMHSTVAVKSPSSLLVQKIEGLSDMICNLRGGMESANILSQEIIQNALIEGLSIAQVRRMLKVAVIRRGLTDRTFYRYLPQSLKNPIQVESGKKAHHHEHDSVSKLSPTFKPIDSEMVNSKGELLTANPDTMSGLSSLAIIAQLEKENEELNELLKQKDEKIAELENELAMYRSRSSGLTGEQS